MQMGNNSTIRKGFLEKINSLQNVIIRIILCEIKKNTIKITFLMFFSYFCIGSVEIELIY